MGERQYMEGLLAQSRYERLSNAEQAALDRYLADHPELRAEGRQWDALREALPAEPIVFQGDLVPVLRERIREAPGRSLWVWRPALAGAAVVALAVVGTLYGVSNYSSGPEPHAIQRISPLGASMEVAKRLIERRDYTSAYTQLASTLEVHPEDPLASGAQLLLADVAYEELMWFPEALASYRAALGEAETMPGEAIDRARNRAEILAEAERIDPDFGPLYALAAARRAQDFERFERIASLYPGTWVATSAAYEMATLAAPDEDGGDPGAVRLAGLEAALQRCTNPRAVAQLKLETAHVLRDDLGDRARALDLYRDVAQSDVATLARRAQDEAAATAP